jgi:hypothetical protein
MRHSIVWFALLLAVLAIAPFAAYSGTSASRTYVPLAIRTIPPTPTRVPPTPIPPPATPTIPPLPPTGIINGDFERGRGVGWIEESKLGFPLIVQRPPLPVNPYNGSWAVWMGGAPGEFATLKQTFIVPPDRPVLTFQYGIIAQEEGCGFAYDTGYVAVGTVLLMPINLCVSRNTGGWRLAQIDMHDFAGQAVTLTVRIGTNENLLIGHFFLDDVKFVGNMQQQEEGAITPFVINETYAETFTR